MKMFLASVLLVIMALTGCDRTPGVRTSQSAGGPGNAPRDQKSPSASVTPHASATP